MSPVVDRDEGVRVTKLARDVEHGEWAGRITVGGQTVRVDRRYGSWRMLVRPYRGAHGLAAKHPPTWIAAELQARALRLERREAASQGARSLPEDES